MSQPVRGKGNHEGLSLQIRILFYALCVPDRPEPCRRVRLIIRIPVGPGATGPYSVISVPSVVNSMSNAAAKIPVSADGPSPASRADNHAGRLRQGAAPRRESSPPELLPTRHDCRCRLRAYLYCRR